MIIYTINLSNYIKKKLEKDLEYFNEIVNHDSNKDKKVILLLNMTDTLNYFYPLYNYSTFFPDFDQDSNFITISKHILHQYLKVRRDKVFPHFVTLINQEQFMILSCCIRNIIANGECNCELQQPNLSHKKYDFTNMNTLTNINFRYVHQSHRKMGMFMKK